MKLLLKGHNDRYAIEQIQLSLFPAETMEPVQQPFTGDGAVSSLCKGKHWLTATTTIHKDGRVVHASRRLAVNDETFTLRRRILQQSYYLAALQLLEQAPAWGALSGVRPTKLTTRLFLAGGTASEAQALLKDTFYVRPDRRRLCIEVSHTTVEAVKRLAPQDVSLYIGIPFCPTRCAYCSFVSQATKSNAVLVEDYLTCLLQELKLTAELLRQGGRTLRTLYIGGGTPTTLTTAQMSRLQQAIAESFDLSRLAEYTIEGGRPDTLDPEKLAAMHRLGCTRMSINPQSMTDEVLKNSCRPHTAAQIETAYRQAQEAGFTSINMDVIAGLPGETPDSFAASLDRLIRLRPSNLTVHTLTMKKGADFFARRQDLAAPEAVSQMVDYATRVLPSAGYSPYYLYRQKYMSGSFENVGWCREQDYCLYNIYMMEELHTILSVGGGGMSKVTLSSSRLERFHNPKFPAVYIRQFDAVLEKKKELFHLLNRLPLKEGV